MTIVFPIITVYTAVETTYLILSLYSIHVTSKNVYKLETVNKRKLGSSSYRQQKSKKVELC